MFNPIISNSLDAKYSILSYAPRIQQDDTTVDASIMIDDSMTFRDPDGTCMQIGDRIIRFVYPSAAVRVREFLSSDFAHQLLAEKILPGSRILDTNEYA